MAKNPWILPEGFDASSRSAAKALLKALRDAGADIPNEAYLALQAGDINTFLEFIDFDKIRNNFDDLRLIMESTARLAGQSTFKLGGVDAKLLFDIIDERAVNYAQERTGQLIVEITDQMRETVRNTIARATAGEMTFQQAAIRLQATIPLTPRDAGAVDKYIQKQFERFMRAGLSEAKARVRAQNMGARYASKLLGSRTRTIARTEIADAAMNGRYLGWESGVSQGVIAADSVKEWIAEPDACPICSALDGTLIGWNDDWTFPEGVSAGTNNRMPPAHPNCRCSVAILPPDFSNNVFTPTSGGEMPDEADEFMKHQLGRHDQSRHANRKVAGVPQNIDLDGKRWNQDARRELGARFNAYEKAKDDVFDKLVAERHDGKMWQELSYMEQSEARGYWDEVKQDPSVLAAKQHLEEHFIFAEAASLTATDGGLIGDKGFDQSYSPLEKLTRLGGSRDFGNEWDKKDADRTIEEFVSGKKTKLYPDPNVEFDVSGVSITEGEALQIANDDWNEYVATTDPQIIMSATAAQRVLTSGRVKTVYEVGRPARTGASNDDYLDTRLTYENVAFGYDNSTPVDKRPVSGMLGQGEPYSEFMNIYGGKNPAVIQLKPSVKERTTYTLDDSLNGFVAPSPVNNPPALNLNYRTAEAGVYGKATGRNWWADNKINAPETQIHGGVSIGDIAKITFYGTPSASVIATVERKGVPYTIETPTGRSGFEE